MEKPLKLPETNYKRFSLRDKQRKYSLLRGLYRLDMKLGTPLRDHEETFDVLVQSLSDIGKSIDPDELIILFAISLPVEIFGLRPVQIEVLHTC